jgi:hypothetical protein
MNSTLHTRTVFGLLVLTLIAPPAWAGTADPEFGFDASAGYRYDSNVNIAEIDANTGESDSALVLDLGVDGALSLSERLTLRFAYGYSDTTYRDFSEFDLAIHHLRGELGYRIAGFDSALSVDRFTASLDDEGFLDIARVSPSLSRLIGKRLYVRGAWAQTDKSYDGRAKRDAVNDSIRGDVYILIDGMQRYLSLTVLADSEDAMANELDYDGRRARLAYGHRIDAGRMGLDLNAYMQIEHRDYASVAESTEAPRRDERFRSGLSAALPLSEHFELNGEIEFADNASTQEAARFDETVFTVNVALSF